MWQLYQFPLCPFSRKLRLLMGEKNIAYELVREHPWEGRDEFWHLNPAGRTPVLHDAGRGVSLSDSQAICEFLEETVERNPMINGSALQRAEIRRLVALFDENLYADVSGPLLHERMKKRLVLRQPPDSRVLREAMKNAHAHLDYIDW
ncbi:MAG TPA: glutathione S-transferase, partial [Erythrobacter sp.]|nr:glutathione S-transferase [Erythrobacter sp.]